MENNKKSTLKTISDFIKRCIFFRVPKKEKEYIKEVTMQNDHQSFRRMVVCILIFQIIMIIYKCVSTGLHFAQHDIQYLICYIGLASTMAIAYPLTDYLRKNNQYNAYFYVVAFIVDVFYAWGLCITLIDSRYGVDLTTFSYVAMGLTAFIVLEPWVFMIDTVGFAGLLCLIITFNPDMKLYPSVIVSAISVAVLTSIIGTINFNRRIDTYLLHREIYTLNDALKSSVYVDDLTKVKNRRFLTEHINDNLYIGLTPSGVIMLDIDDFKLINDAFGHQNGDLILELIGKRLVEFVNEFKDSYCVRYGGEEFLIFIPHISKNSLAEAVEKIRLSISETPYKLLDDTEINVTISVGASTAKTGINYSALINNADEALYESKDGGKNKSTIK